MILDEIKKANVQALKDKNTNAAQKTCAAFAALGERLYGDEYGWVKLVILLKG